MFFAIEGSKKGKSISRGEREKSIPLSHRLAWPPTARARASTSPIMQVLVHVKEKCIPVSVGNGDQPVRWLANVGIARHDDNQGRMLGLPVGVKAEEGSMLNMDSTLVAAQISDMQHVWVHFKGA